MFSKVIYSLDSNMISFRSTKSVKYNNIINYIDYIDFITIYKMLSDIPVHLHLFFLLATFSYNFRFYQNN